MFHLFVKGSMIGFLIAAPVGPVGIICINRSLQNGFLTGFISGCGASIADGLYGIIAGFGLTSIADFLIDHKLWIRLIGGSFLIFLGLKTLLKKSHVAIHEHKQQHHLLHACYSTLFVTLTSPMTILSFIAVFAGLGLGHTHTQYIDACAMVLGVILGSLLWWFILCIGVAFLSTKINKTASLHWINVIAGIIIMIFGIIALID